MGENFIYQEKYPIDLSYKSTNDIDFRENPKWEPTRLSGIIKYYGKIEREKITLNIEDNIRVFNKIQ